MEQKRIVLAMKHISKKFTGVSVLEDVNFDLREGEVHALVGENGAGKSTLMKILGGIYSKDQGEIWIDGQTVEINHITDAQKYGISIIHQELSIVPDMTVAENVFLGRMPSTKMNLIDDAKAIRDTQKMLGDFGLNHIDPREKAGKLSVAQQQMVEIMRELSTDAKILVMDEPTASLTDSEIEKLFVFIEDLQKRGTSIIYISHRMEELFKMCARSTVLRDGKCIGTVDMCDIDYDGLVSMMVGRKFENVYPHYEGRKGKELLRVEHLNAGRQVQDVSFELREGEILGFYGLMGSGRTESMCALFGVNDKKTSGDIYIEGKQVTIENSAQAIGHGIMLAPESRKEHGLVLIQDVRYNTTLAILDQIISGIRPDKAKEKQITESYVKELDIKTSGLEQVVMKLSGGNQQKIVLAKCLATKPKVLILDEPTRGIDVGAKCSIYELITALAGEGIGVIFISSEMPEVVNLCTRVIVMREGRIMGEVEQDDITEQTIMKYSLGGISQ